MKRLTLLFLLLTMSLSCYAALQPLASDKAFELEAKVIDPNTLQFDWNMPASYFLYKERFAFHVVKGMADIGYIHLPKSETKTDVALGTHQIYRQHINITVPFLAKAAEDMVFQVSYQGCTDSGFCYPPTQQKFVISVNDELAATNIVPLKTTTAPPPDTSGSNGIKHLFDGNSWLLLWVSFFGLGLLLAFTPCVLPMFPILSGIIVGHGTSLTTAKAFRLSLTYVLSMALTYTAIGILFATIGSNLQASLQQPWIITLFAGVFVVLALSMFGLYDITLPKRLQARFAAFNQRQSGGHYASVAIMGCLSTLILSPCVTAPLVGVLGYITESGNIILGGTALFAMGLGMGFPLLLVGTSGGKLLPKAGTWMNYVKYVFGVLLLAVAITLLDRIVSPPVTMALWASLLVIGAIYLGALQRQPSSNAAKFYQGIGILLLVYGILLVIGASLGSSNLFRPLENLTLQPQKAESIQTINVKTVQDVETAIKKAGNKPVLLDFYADWCVSCKIMEHQVFTNPKVRQALKQFVILRADITANDATDKRLSSHYGVIAPPTFLFFDPNGEQLQAYKLVGELNATAFLKHLQHFLDNVQ